MVNTVQQILQLTPQQVSGGTPVRIEGVVTYYQPVEHILFVQDKTGPIFIHTHKTFPFVQGDTVMLSGVTTGHYRPSLISDDMHVIGKAQLPKPAPATFPQMLTGQWDCSYVTISGRVLSATMQQTPGQPFLLLEVEMDGGLVDVHVDKPQGLDLKALLDSQVVLTGVSGGHFDGKFQLIGTALYVSSPAEMHVTAPAPIDPATLPLTPIDHVMSGYDVIERSRRVKVRGSITLYGPGSQLVLEDGTGKAILIHTHQNTPAQIGDVVDATGFPYTHDYTLSLTHGEFTGTGTGDRFLIHPQPVEWQDAILGKYALNLISLDGRVIEQVHGASQDTLFLNSNGHVFSAALRHSGKPSTALPTLRAGSRVRVSGVCFIESGGPWNGALAFELRLRDAGDVRILTSPPWLTMAHLLYVTGALGLVMLGVLVWGTMLRRRVHQQTRVIHTRMEEEAARERRLAFLERERGRVLEAINSQLPLDDVLRMITGFISERVDGLECWCELDSVASPNARAAEDHQQSPEHHGTRQFRRDILSSKGERLGALALAWNTFEEQHSVRPEVLDIGVSLAALAIDNRRFYEGLVHRSHYDQLTGVPNRFLLESRLKEVFDHARRNEQYFALIYIDLDRFKSINDCHGHRIGDIYLQNVALRLSERLRAQDILARVGGDEFIALIPDIQNRSEAEEIGRRLATCFDSPFRIDGRTMDGTASIGIAIYPEDGMDEEQLKRFADLAMYASKQRAIMDRE